MSIFNNSQSSATNSASIWSESPDKPMIDIRPTDYLQKQGWPGRLFACVLLLLSLPVIGVFVVLIRIGSRGPGTYKQVRVGKDGRIFVMYKLRSMVQDAEVGLGPVWTQDHNDPRITAIGRFIRKSHLDELPQLLNVVRGEMALFGPRPERPQLVQILADNIPGYLNRLAIRPGITGLAQINLPPDTDLESVRRKLQLDIKYIQTASFWMDIRMFCWTVFRLLAVPAGTATRLTKLGCDIKPVTAKADGPITIHSILNDGPDCGLLSEDVSKSAGEPLTAFRASKN